MGKEPVCISIYIVSTGFALGKPFSHSPFSINIANIPMEKKSCWPRGIFLKSACGMRNFLYRLYATSWSKTNYVYCPECI